MDELKKKIKKFILCLGLKPLLLFFLARFI